MTFTKILRHLCLGLVFLFLSSVSAPVWSLQDEYLSPEALAHYTMGLIYDQYGLSDDAIEEYKKALDAQQGPSYQVHLKLGYNYARTGALSDAIRELKLVSKFNPDELQSHYLLALIYSTQKNYDLAADEYEVILQSLLKSEPENVEIYGYLGQLYYSQKEYDKAIEQFERVLTLEPKNAEVMYLLGSLYLEIDQKEKAIALFLESITIDPEHHGSLNSLGYLYAQEGMNLDEALQMVQRAITLDPENGAYLDSLGWIQFKKGEYKEALETLKKADTLLQDPIIYEHMGDVYFELNQTENAKKYWDLSLKLFPDQVHILEKLERLKRNSAARARPKK